MKRGDQREDHQIKGLTQKITDGYFGVVHPRRGNAFEQEILRQSVKVWRIAPAKITVY